MNIKSQAKVKYKELFISNNKDMVEYEIKFQADRSVFSRLIENLSYVGEKQQNDTYYDTPDYTLFLNAVFLRERNKKVIDIKYNFDKSDISHLFCNENSFNLPLSKDANKSLDIFLSQLIVPSKNDVDILDKYNLVEFVVINKNRRIYSGSDIELSHDIINNIGEFIEIEAKTDKGINYINNLMSKENIQRIKTGYVELYLKKYNYELYKKGKYLAE